MALGLLIVTTGQWPNTFQGSAYGNHNKLKSYCYVLAEPKNMPKLKKEQEQEIHT
ncbi:hypothetical protein PIROE2DRAFT_10942 [Piromyces sp. E2]|nr:hypothetical protein PIROE2DRAFT_10942 [Piromyces sp. E2]|eukprot:OUM62683.1 hypothetical protein PIROE2DRAFT_10942 [Piromyces sp. E2]